MPSSSKAQQKFMGIVHSVQKGDTKPSDVSQSVRDAAKSMSKKDAKDYASTPVKGLPNKVRQEIVKKLKEYANKMGLDHLGGDSIPSNKKRGGLRDFDGYDNVDYNRDMPMDEAYIVLYSPKKGVKPVATAAYRDKKDAQKWEKDLKREKGGGITMLVQKKMKGIDEAKLIEACWKGYKAVGGKIKNGKQVPNCVPESVNEAKVETERYFGKKGIIIMIRDGNKMISAIFKDKKNADKFNRNKPADVKKLVQLAKKTKYPKAIDEGGLPQNWMSGRTSDYHTKLRGKKRNYDDTNFAKMNTGQPDIPEEEKDDEIVNEKFNKVEHLSLLNKALKAMPGSQNQKEIIRQLNVVRKAGGMRPLKETAIEEYASRLTNAYILDDESILKGTPKPKDAINRESAKKKSEKNYKDWKNTNESLNSDISNAKKRLKDPHTIEDIEYSKTRRGDKFIKIIYKKKYVPGKMMDTGPHFVSIFYNDEKELQNIGKALKLKLKEGIEEETKRDYKDEYKKFQSSTKSKKYRAELNKYNRDKGTYGNGDGKDASHKGGKIVGFESASKNRGRKEKSRLKKNK